MSTIQTQTSTVSIEPATQCGVVSLSVANLARSIGFYTDALGFSVLQQSRSDAVLGAAGVPLLLLKEETGALPWMVDNATGLYHFAILLPTRGDLGRWLRHFITRNYSPPGQGDHVVSEALYLRDPDGHGIEVYRDRPREEWVWTNGTVKMGSGPVDVRGMIAEANAAGLPWTGLPAGTILGHIHLQVGDIRQAEAFYHGVLGFDIVASMGTALFVSAGGYHHHVGLNTWHSQGASPAPEGTATLRFFTLSLPTDAARAEVAARLAAAGIAYEDRGNTVVVRDPSRNTIILHTGVIGDARTAAELAG
jgi:catechol 2,3-dioxygenase